MRSTRSDIVSVEFSSRLQRDLAALIAKGGMHRQQAKLASKVAAGVIDDHARSAYRSFPYMWGSTARALNGYTDKKGGYHAPRERFRVWASRKASLKFRGERAARLISGTVRWSSIRTTERAIRRPFPT